MRRKRKDDNMAHVITKFERPSGELISAFGNIGSATVYEAAGRKGSVDPAIKPLYRRFKLLGPALTVQCFPNDNLMLHKALEIAQPGDVIVASTNAYPDAGYFGGLMATSAKARGIGGLAIDGCIRDSLEIIDMGFSIFCKGTCIRGTEKRNLGAVNHSLLFGDVIINPGDLIIGDDDGISVVPLDKIEIVLEASRKRVEKEFEKAALLKKGITSVEINKLDKVFQSLGLIEE
jgi:4-hydroxy-4-methyl-2-oxoglutarate aldolase